MALFFKAGPCFSASTSFTEQFETSNTGQVLLFIVHRERSSSSKLFKCLREIECRVTRITLLSHDVIAAILRPRDPVPISS